jgi:hypothetical protein
MNLSDDQKQSIALYLIYWTALMIIALVSDASPNVFDFLLMFWVAQNHERALKARDDNKLLEARIEELELIERTRELARAFAQKEPN